MASNSPQLTLPASETISAQATLAVSGISYTDSFAAANPGAMYLHVWDSAGLLSGANAAGALVPGSGTGSITLSASYADVTAVLASLSYAAAATAGSDSIQFELWDQAGVETTGSIPVSVTAASGGATLTDTWTGAVSGDWNAEGNWSAGSAPASGTEAVIPGGTPHTPSLSGATLSGETVTLTNGGGQGGSADFSNVTLGAGTLLQDLADDTLPQPAISLAGTFAVASGATLAAGSGSLMVLHSASAGTPASMVNHGTIAGTGGHLNIDTGGTVVNDGLITASGSGGVGFDFGQFTNSMPQETILNAGTIQAAGGSLYINGTVHGGLLQFSGAGEMVFEQQNALAGGASIAGFGAGDTIDLYLIQADKLSFGNGVLTVTNAGTTVESLPMAGNYTTANFQLIFQPSEEFSNVIAYVPDQVASAPQIAAPASETVPAGGTVAVGGVSITDSFAAGNPGSMALNVADSSGALSMTDTSGAALSGSGTGAIHYSGTFSQVNAALATLHYAAGGTPGSDTITIDIWDQAGKEATSSVAVTIGSASSAGGGGSGGSSSMGGGGSPSPTGGGTVVNGTPGDDTIVSNLNGVTINAGAGNDTVFAGGTGDTITATGGNNTIQAFAGNNRITTGAGDDTVRIAGTGNTLNAGGGANRIEDSGSGNTLVLPGAGQGTDDVYGYVLTANDMFDLRGALSGAGWNGSAASLSSYLGVGTVNNGADTTISVTPGGQGTGAVVATLHGNGAIALPDFLTHALVS